MEDITVTHSLDTTGKSCPVPMMETNFAMKKLEPGQILEIIATDLGTRKDIPSWCERKGHTLLEARQEKAALRYFVKKGGG